MGLDTAGPVALITDLAVWEADPDTGELTVTQLHPGVTVEMVQDTCGWPARFAPDVVQTPPPDETELSVLRELKANTARANAAG